MSRTFAYCRVSTLDQNADNQVLEITNAGFSLEPRRIVREIISGAVPATGRPQFRRLLDRLESGDRLVVTKLDRLGRNAMDVRTTVDGLEKDGIKVHCLALGGVDLTSPAGKMTMAVINAIAEFERDLLIERTQAGLARARAAGKVLGRRSVLTQQEARQVATKRSQGFSLGVLAKEYGVSRAAIQRIQKRYAESN